MNAATRLITGLGHYDHITPTMRNDLHLLPVKLRIDYKIALLVYKCLNGAALSYLIKHCNVLTAADRHYQLCSVTWGEALGYQALLFGTLCL